jgi:predicted ferric reductase
LIIVVSVIFILTLISIKKRREFQPLKSTSMWLIWLSTFANFCCFLCLMINKILDNPNWNFWSNLVNGVTSFFHPESAVAKLATTASTYGFGVTAVIETTCFLDYLNWRFFRVIWLVPYLFRILRLNQIWNFHKVYKKAEEEVLET